MYKGRWFIRENVYICGDYMDADIYPVFQSVGKRRSKCNPTSEIQEKLNQRNAEKKLTRLIHTNFTEEDIALHLTYRDGCVPNTPEEAQKDLYNFIRRIKRRYKKIEIDFKYISCTEYGKSNGRVHHHLIASGGLDRDLVEKLWGRGYANSKRLQFEDNGVAGLAHYVAKDKNFYKRWNQSKNLIQPEPFVRDAAISQKELSVMENAIESKKAWQYFSALYPEFTLTDAAASRNAVNKGTYIHYEMRKTKGKDNGNRTRGLADTYTAANSAKATDRNREKIKIRQ